MQRLKRLVLSLTLALSLLGGYLVGFHQPGLQAVPVPLPSTLGRSHIPLTPPGYPPGGGD